MKTTKEKEQTIEGPKVQTVETLKTEESQALSKKDHAIGEIRNLRQDMDATLEAMNVINNKERSRELSLACTSLQLARMWFGKALMTLGEAGYKNDGKRKNVGDIEPPTDKATETDGSVPDNRVEALDFFREKLRETTKKVKEASGFIALGPNVASQTVINLTESVMWLGADLGRLYEENKSKK